MSNVMSELETILGMCEYSKHKKMASELSRAEKELIAKIRTELTELAGPEDIDVVKIIKQELNKKYGVESIRNVDMSKTDWISDMRNAIVNEIREEMDNKILDYINERNNHDKKKDDIDLIEIPDPTGRSITGTYDTNNPLNDDNDWMNKYEDPEKYKK